jgi:hypothetical protein
MIAKKRRDLLQRLNAYDSGSTEDDRRATREVAIERAIETEGALKWGRLQAGSLWGMFGRTAASR